MKGYKELGNRYLKHKKKHAALVVTSIHKLLDQIPSALGVHGIQVAQTLGVVQREAVVMPGGQSDVFTACCCRCFCPSRRTYSFSRT